MDDVLGKVLGPTYREGKLNRQIASYRKSGHSLAAGKLLEDAGRLSEAADAYLEGQEFFAAATTLEKMGKLDKAAEHYLQSGGLKKAANVYIAARSRRGGAAFLEEGQLPWRRRAFRRGRSNEDKAADLYNKGGYPLRAAEAYQKKEEWERAAECYEEALHGGVVLQHAVFLHHALRRPENRVAGGPALERAGPAPPGAADLRGGGYFKEAADVCMRRAIRREGGRAVPARGGQRAGCTRYEKRASEAGEGGEPRAARSRSSAEGRVATWHFLEGQD